MAIFPCAVQYTLLICFIHSSLCLSVFYPYLSPAPSLSLLVSLSVLLHIFVYFLNSHISDNIEYLSLSDFFHET